MSSLEQVQGDVVENWHFFAHLGIERNEKKRKLERRVL